MALSLEKQVVSLPLAKRLKELGVNQESEFIWCPLGGAEHGFFHDDRHGEKPVCAAHTVAELGEMLGKFKLLQITTGTGSEELWAMQFHLGDRFWVMLVDLIGSRTKVDMIANTEADARAKMLVYLIENKLLPTETQESIDGRK